MQVLYNGRYIADNAQEVENAKYYIIAFAPVLSGWDCNGRKDCYTIYTASTEEEALTIRRNMCKFGSLEDVKIRRTNPFVTDAINIVDCDKESIFRTNHPKF